MFTLLGGGTAAVLSSLTFLGVNVTIGENSPAFMEWGWRIPFLISAGLIAIALYVRMRIDETPVFVEEKARNLVPSAPIAELLRLQRREIVLAGGSILGGMCFVYMSNTYLTRYAHAELGYTRSFIWAVGALGGLVSIAFVALSATLCDRVGRRRMMLLGWAGCVPWALVVIPLIDTGNRCSTRWRSSACARSAGSVPGPREPSFPSCLPPATATADRHWRSTWPASSAGHCHP